MWRWPNSSNSSSSLTFKTPEHSGASPSSSYSSTASYSSQDNTNDSFATSATSSNDIGMSSSSSAKTASSQRFTIRSPLRRSPRNKKKEDISALNGGISKTFSGLNQLRRSPRSKTNSAFSSLTSKNRSKWSKWCLTYGLRIVSYGDVGGEMNVTCANCRFCEAFGKSGIINKTYKRQINEHNVKSFSGPTFATGNFASHLNQHSALYAEYRQLNDSDKKIFFDEKGLGRKQQSLEGCGFQKIQNDCISFEISKSIVDRVVSSMYFNEAHLRSDSDDEFDGNRDRAQQQKMFENFKLSESIDGKQCYTVSIKNPKRYQMAMEFVAIGMSFSQTEKAMRITAAEGLTNMAGLNRINVSSLLRATAAVNLQKLSNVLSDKLVPCFSLGCDSTTHGGRSYFDIRVSFSANGLLYNCHLVLVPVFGSGKAEPTVALIIRVLDAVVPEWRHKLMSVSTDGENTMTGRIKGVVTLLEKQAQYKVSIVFHMLTSISYVNER